MTTTLDDAKIPWVGFNLVKGIGPIRLKALITAFGDIESAWNASASQLEESGLPRKLITAMRDVRDSGLLEKTLQKIAELEIQVFTWDDPSYPSRLSEIDQSPPVLYCLGTLNEQDHWAVAVVGTRKVSTYGRQAAREIVSLLAQNGLTPRQVAVATIDTSFVYRGDGRYEGLLVETDVTEAIAERLARVPSLVEEARRTLGRLDEPAVAVGTHCGAPHGCAFYAH